MTDIAPAAESGMDLSGQAVMTTKFCLKLQRGLCPRQARGKAPVAEPLCLVDEEGRRLRLQFNCGPCEMEVIL